MKETIVRIIRGSFAGVKLPDIDFKIIKYREDDGNLELEPLLARHAPLGIKHIAYPSIVIFLEPKDKEQGMLNKVETNQPTTITPQQRRQLKKGLAERTKVRRRKEDERRQHIYK